eukprot:992143-Alexandrium_andersonii.AAC.1
MSASLVGSEMCIRDSAGIARATRALSADALADPLDDWGGHLHATRGVERAQAHGGRPPDALRETRSTQTTDCPSLAATTPETN